MIIVSMRLAGSESAFLEEPLIACLLKKLK